MLVARDDAGADVKHVQGLVRDVAYNQLQVTGHFGLETELAVLAFQAWNNLQVDGVVGDGTYAALQHPAIKGSPNVLIDTKLGVPYFSQRDNRYNPGGTCNVTCLAMALASKGIAPRHPEMQFEDELYLFLQSEVADAAFKNIAPSLYGKVKPQHVHTMLAWCAQEYGAKDSKVAGLSVSDIAEEVAGGPILLSGRFTGSGHIVLAVGCSANGDILVHDPWGDWNRGYGSYRNGEFRVYRAEALQDVLKPPAGHEKHVTLIR